MSLSDTLDLELAWKKTERNLREKRKVFINDPYIRDILDNNKDEYIKELSNKIDGGYNPSSSRIVNVPKRNWRTRPASVLTIDDLVIYSAIVIELYEDIKNEIQWSSQEQRFSRILLDDIDNSHWMDDSMNNWRKWNKKSVDLCEEYDYVLNTDITSYFENIEHQILDSYIGGIYEDDNKVLRNTLKRCLQQWSEPKNRGLPQGYYPSNVLSELYLNNIDRRIESRGLIHTRFSDDTRIYCDTKEEAIDTLKYIIELYQKKGLYLNKQKTEILEASEAKDRFEDTRKEIKEIHARIKDTIKKEREQIKERIQARREFKPDNEIPYTDGEGNDGSYLNRYETKDSLEITFREHFINGDGNKKSLFNYLLPRLGYVDSFVPLSYCIEKIKQGSPRIRKMMQYFSNLSIKQTIGENLLDLVKEDEIIYDFQKFIIVRWVYQAQLNTEKILSIMRDLLRQNHGIPEIKNYAFAYVGTYGNKGDYEMITEEYPKSTSNVRKSIMLVSIRKMDPDLRGSFYSSAESDHLFCDLSTRYVRNTHG